MGFLNSWTGPPAEGQAPREQPQGGQQMIQGGKDVDVVTAEGSFIGFKRQEAGVGFRLEPVSGKAAFPVHVVVDNQTAVPVVVEGPDWNSGGQPFSKLKVDV